MLATLESKLLAALGCLLLIVAVVASFYVMRQHEATQKAEIAQLQADNVQEKANTAVALQAASAASAALATKVSVTATATAHAQTSTAHLKAAATASSATAEVTATIVPESVWSAIYGPKGASDAQ
jgi:hypothetical protein